jgi:hypothetical protein
MTTIRDGMETVKDVGTLYTGIPITNYPGIQAYQAPGALLFSMVS